jgi:hypothetical protein
MGSFVKKPKFIDSEDAVEIRAALKQMTVDAKYNTTSTYSANSERYSDNLIPFVDKHMNYLVTHPSINPHQYLANVKLMTRVR